MTDINLKEMLFKQKMQEIEDDMVPFGIIDDGSEYIDQIEQKDAGWETNIITDRHVYDPDF